tara:strand:+ start:458 stop:718 length:261 start_codon:yes stop_codon:yes gene_type:complete
MKPKDIYNEFEEISKKLGLKIIKGKGDFVGGECVLNNEKVIVINKLKPIEHRLKILAIIFLKYNLEDIYMLPYMRAFIQNYSSLDL